MIKMILSSIIIIGCISNCLSHCGMDWDTFKTCFAKTYGCMAEENYRQNIFKRNVEFITEFNKKYEEGSESFLLSVNHLTDMTREEVVTKMTGFQSSPTSIILEGSSPSNLASSSSGSIPATKNWVTVGAVSPVKNQLTCGCCWAFSAAGALEGRTYIARGHLIPLSAQNLVDCSTSNYGCYGGMMTEAFQYVIDNKGIDIDISYPYQAQVGPCKYNSTKIGAKCTGFVEIPEMDEDTMLSAVGMGGPVSAALDSSLPTFQYYSNGIYDDSYCDPENLNHAVLIVGYGTENGKDYWLIKNSWGTGWGISGYMKIARNKNMCGIAMYASYPLV